MRLRVDFAHGENRVSLNAVRDSEVHLPRRGLFMALHTLSLGHKSVTDLVVG